MPSITSLSFFSTVNYASATSPSLPLFPFPRHTCKSKVSCKVGDHNQNPKGNRRDVLIGLGGGLGAAASFTYNPFATADPVVTDHTNCGDPNLPAGAKPTKCCPPNSNTVTDFVLPSNQPLRIRQPAHALSDDNINKYKEAIKLMKALPDDDPRSFLQQGKIHCAYCHDSYYEEGCPDKKIQVHFSCIFAPFHRWYLYFYERILGSLIGDPTFALPFWNWDHPDGMEIPAIFADRRSPLYNPLRNANHQPPTLLDLDWNKNDVDTSGDVEKNLKKVHKFIYQVKRPTCFFGRSFVTAGSLESLHNTLHSWSGDRTQPNGEDMGSFYSSGRDPLFYGHHSNVDRLWTVWKSFGREDLNNRDYLESSFLFYNENKNLVRVKTKDCLDTLKLGYEYQPVEVPWKDAKSSATTSKAQRMAKPFTTTKALDLPLILFEEPVSTVVKRPQKSRSQKEKDLKEETLVFDIQFNKRGDVKFDVLIDWEGNPKIANPKNREFAGSFVNVNHADSSRDTNVKYAIGITELLEDLEADDDDSIVVTLVPRYGRWVIIKDITINFEECENKK
ncbi:hypothetical protein PIB30_059473 [Stylosanthes scabra]|uniref:Tyrosinase copper-binding domain-containing protein n=1 Tax=Stylosanthes scabra TaxID=79078 RepID=A0ABU6QK46_9FABA|nr:hypothetical protein [Stylosanthes scabra]